MYILIYCVAKTTNFGLCEYFLLIIISKQICNKAMYDTRKQKAMCSIVEAETNSVVKCSEMNV